MYSTHNEETSVLPERFSTLKKNLINIWQEYQKISILIIKLLT